jgi:DNA-binding SARP family transcriptional activator
MVGSRVTRTDVEFGVLGPLVASVGGRAIELTGAKERCLLAFLLLHANETVSVDRLIDALWPDDPPPTARNTLQAHVSRLRKVIGARRLATFANGYSLAVRPEELDLFRFRELVAQARRDLEGGEQVRAAEKLAEALALWRGEPLPEFSEHEIFRVEVSRLEEERLTAFEAWVDAELDLGRAGELVAELEAAVAANPLRERLMGQLMMALYRAGRQVEALETYGRARRRMVEELGLEPGPLLSDLHQRILAQDPALSAPSRALARNVGTPSRRNLTVVVAALSVRIGLDPEVAGRMLEDVRTRARAVFEDHGALVSLVRDGVVGTFGLPVTREDDPLRAIRAASELSREPEVTLAVDTGVALASDSALVDDRFVALVAKLAEAAHSGDIVLGPGARSVLAEAVEVTGSVLVSFDPAAEPIARHFDAPLIGRESEFGRLRESLSWAVRNRNSHLVTVLGPAGIGKSRLASELATTVSKRATMLSGRCLPYGSGAFWPLAEMVRQAAGDTTPDALHRVLSNLEDRRLVIDQIAAALGTGVDMRAEDAFWAFRKLFAALAADRPLILLFEDLHWAEGRLLDFIEELVARAKGAPILAVCLARPDLLEERPSWGGGGLDAELIQLAPLTAQSSEELIGVLGAAVCEDARDQIATRAEGNPLFIEQLVALAVDDPEAPPDAIPLSIHAVLAARIDRLAPDERALLQGASIIGLEFPLSGVAALSAEPGEGLSLAARRLVQKDLLRPVGPEIRGADEYRFRHILIRDAVYGSVLKSTRAELHESFARWLEQDLQDRASEVEEIIGYHLERSYELRTELEPGADGLDELANEAGERLAGAGRRELERSGASRGINLLERALRLLDPRSTVRGEALAQLSYSYRLTGDWGGARRYLEDGFAWATSAGDVSLTAYLAVSELQLRLHTEPGFTPDEFIRASSGALGSLADVTNSAWKARIQVILAWPYALLGKNQLAMELVEGSDSASEQLRDSRKLLPSVWLAGPIAVDECVAKCETLLREDPTPRTVASCYRSLAVLEAMRGDFDAARRLCELDWEILDELGTAVLRQASVSVRGTVELLAGEPGVAERWLRDSIGKLERLGATMHAAGLSAQLARALVEQGRYKEAWAIVESPSEASACDVANRVDFRGIRGRLLAWKRLAQHAELVGREAVAIADQTDSPDLQACGRLDLAHALNDSGLDVQARSVLRESLNLFEKKGNLVEAARTRALLDY